MLDYDGTLAPFKVVREAARPRAGSVRLLRAIAASPATTVAIVSGRPILELQELLGPLDAVLVGEHGWEVLPPDGRRVLHPLSPADALRFESASRAAIDRGYNGRLERKRTSLVLHTRGLPPDQAAAAEKECEEVWMRLGLGGDLRIARVNGGIELRAQGRDKGTAVRELIEMATPGSLPVYLGDDETDEDAFREIGDRGFSIRIGDRSARTEARGRLGSVSEVREFLRRWLRTVERVRDGDRRRR
jgi:trehalose 6-phosphate phosphatase